MPCHPPLPPPPPGPPGVAVPGQVDFDVRRAGLLNPFKCAPQGAGGYGSFVRGCAFTPASHHWKEVGEQNRADYRKAITRPGTKTVLSKWEAKAACKLVAMPWYKYRSGAGPHALAEMRHWLGASGVLREENMLAMLRESAPAHACLFFDLAAAMAAAEALAPAGGCAPRPFYFATKEDLPRTAGTRWPALRCRAHSAAELASKTTRDWDLAVSGYQLHIVARASSKGDFFSMDAVLSMRDWFDSFNELARDCVLWGHARWFPTWGRVRVRLHWFRGQRVSELGSSVTWGK